MTKPALIPEMSVAVPASTCARLRHGLGQMLKEARRTRERVPDDVAEAIALIDQLGAAWEQRARRTSPSYVSPDLSSVAAGPFAPVEWAAMTTKHAADQLGITPQAVTGLLVRGSLHGVKTGRTWRVCSESVTARKAGSQCPH